MPCRWEPPIFLNPDLTAIATDSDRGDSGQTLLAYNNASLFLARRAGRVSITYAGQDGSMPGGLGLIGFILI